MTGNSGASDRGTSSVPHHEDRPNDTDRFAWADDPAVRAFVGALVADAVAMPVHWYYDRAALDRDLEAEGRVGHDIDPGRRRRLPGAQHGHVFPAIG